MVNRVVKSRKGDFIGQKYEIFDVLGERGFGRSSERERD